MTPLQVLEGTFPKAECKDNRAEFMVRNARDTYLLRMAGRAPHDSSLHVAHDAITREVNQVAVEQQIDLASASIYVVARREVVALAARLGLTS